MARLAAPGLRSGFEEILDAGRVIDHPLERRLYGRDGSIAEGDCGLVVLPETTAEVAACMRLAAELGVPVVPRGSGTGLCGGAVPLDGAIVLSVARMNRILDVDPAVPCARVEPGVLNLDLSVAVRHLGLHYAPDPSSQQACSIGGNVATNAGGPALPGVRGHLPARPRHGDRARRRRGAAPGRHRPRPARLRPARVRRGRRGHARRGHRGARAPHAAPPPRCARCCSTSPRCATRARPWAGSSRPGSSPRRWR